MVRRSIVVFFVFCVLIQIVNVVIGSALHADSRHNLDIPGGKIVSIETAPFIVALYTDETPSCAGSIVHERFILTAAQCVRDIKSSSIKVLTGSEFLNQNDLEDVEERFFYNDDQDPENYSNDICLLKLKEPLQFRTEVAKVELPDVGFDLGAGIRANITGWDYSHTIHTMRNDLLQATIPIVSQDRCPEDYANFIGGMICGGPIIQDICMYTRGSPLTHNNMQIGVLSLDIGCNFGLEGVGVFTKVSNFTDWIAITIRDNL